MLAFAPVYDTVGYYLFDIPSFQIIKKAKWQPYHKCIDIFHAFVESI